MDPQRWKEIERLYHLAREREGEEREKFLEVHCGGDESLQREVESLLARPPEGNDFQEELALEVAAKGLAKDKTAVPPVDLTGRTIAHYRVLEKIGEGSMGLVYKARDLHLSRFVVLKVLPSEYVADPERKRRFVQEARAASALKHPNIIAIHDINSDAGVDFIVMEYVEGKTLDRRIGRKGLRIGEALKYGAQIADALAAAHAAGIVHRDLKPANIMVTETGLVKVLDFGLAKLTQAIQREVSGTVSPMESLTEDGRILGTVAYMSPEQAEGKAVDGRSDIFSFGSVLYEIVTGQRAFQGTSAVSTLSAILHQEPKPSTTSTPAIPAELERLINRCLRKDLAKRFQHMYDVKIALDELKDELESGRAGAIEVAVKPFSGTRKMRWIFALAGFLVLGYLSISVVWFTKRGVNPPPELTQRRLTMNSIENPVLSGCIFPDGKFLAYSDAAAINLKLIETGEERVNFEQERRQRKSHRQRVGHRS
jgi:eukaryotic-like serine/threonine-protein kinase